MPQSPSNSKLECCCVRDAVLPEQPVKVPELSFSYALPVAAGDLLTSDQQAYAVESSVPDESPGPSLQSLLCVWRL